MAFMAVLIPESGTMAVFDAPRGTGPYGIATTPEGQVFFASLAGNRERLAAMSSDD
jgi:streptogramin lyase